MKPTNSSDLNRKGFVKLQAQWSIDVNPWRLQNRNVTTFKWSNNIKQLTKICEDINDW